MAAKALNALRRGVIAIAFMTVASPTFAAVWHLTEPAQYDDCAATVLATGSAEVLYFPKSIEEIACGDETWGCALAGNIIVSEDAPNWLRPWVEMHEAAHICGWPADHPGGDMVRVTATTPPPRTNGTVIAAR